MGRFTDIENESGQSALMAAPFRRAIMTLPLSPIVIYLQHFTGQKLG
jgi:hypothetical protein